MKNRKRFEREFNAENCDSVEKGSIESFGELLLEKKKPVDFIELFRGNALDQFRLGIRIHKSSISLYTPFYQSDVIVASPLGLRLVMGTDVRFLIK